MLDTTEHNAAGDGMEKQPDAEVVVADTPQFAPNGKKKGASGRYFGDWKDRPKPTFGESLIADLDPEGGILTPEQHSEILHIESADALKTMLYADLGSPLNPNIEACQRVFGDLMTRTIEIPQILMTWQFFTITQCQLCIEDMTAQMRDKTLSGLERVNAGKARLEAVKALNNLLVNARNLAKSVGIMKPIRDRSKPVKTPKNDAPAFG